MTDYVKDGIGDDSASRQVLPRHVLFPLDATLAGGTYALAALPTLYPDHQSYLAAVIKATHETQRDGFMVGADAAATISDAARSNGGRH